MTIEEGSIGGFGSYVQQHLLDAGLLDAGRLRLRSMVLPDRFIEQGTPAGQYEEAGLRRAAIVAAGRQVLGARPARPRPRPAPERPEPAAVPAVFTIGYQEIAPRRGASARWPRPASRCWSTSARWRPRAGRASPSASSRPASPTVGIDYLHLRGLGTPPDGRLAARSGRYADMRRIFEAHLATEAATAELDELARLVEAGRPAVPALLRAPRRPLPPPDPRRAAGPTAGRRGGGPGAVAARQEVVSITDAVSSFALAA